jgi:hypothetical protein
VRAAFVLAVLAACGFDHGVLRDDGGVGSGDGNPGDGSNCAWSYMPTNFDPCELPAPGSLTVSTNTTLDTSSTTQPKKVITQNDGTTITVIHLSQFTVDPLVTLTVTGTGVVFAVDGEATINGTIVVAAGSDNATHCAKGRGTNGADSTTANSGGGGGGGGAGDDDGGDGGDGSGAQAGAKGAKGGKVESKLSPLRGGCPGGTGGRLNGAGTAPAGGRGGGALQISTNTKISIGGFIDAAGRGGAGTTAKVGGGGGGSGGGIFLEGPRIDAGLASRICADGGSGGEGGGITALGNNGEAGACTAIGGAQTDNTPNSSGGDGGSGGFLASPGGGNAQNGVTGDAGGGGGGGGVGWIRIESPDFNNNGAVITPVSM